MRVFKPTYNDRGGTSKRTSRWHVEFRDAWGKKRKAAAFKDKG